VRVKLFCLFVIQLIGIILILSNPKIEKHKEFAQIELTKEFDKPSEYIKGLISVVVDEKITKEDYLFFSLTKFDDLGSLKTLGVGIFGTILPLDFVKDHVIALVLAIIGFFVILRFIVRKYKI